MSINALDNGFRAALTYLGGTGTDTVTVASALTLGSATSAGNLAITAETINLNAGIATDGDTANGDAGSVSLTGSVVLGNSLTIDTNASTTDGQITVTGSISGSAHTLTIDAGTTSVNFSNGANDFGTVTFTSVNSATLVDVNGINLGESSVAGNLSVTAGGAITQSGAATVVGTAGFSAGAHAITLTQGNDFQGAVTVSNSGANDVAVTDTNALTIGGTVGRDLTISAGATTLAATTVGGALSVTATGAIAG